jgi:hypothetical protein
VFFVLSCPERISTTTTIRHYQPTSYDTIRILCLQGSIEEGDN